MSDILSVSSSQDRTDRILSFARKNLPVISLGISLVAIAFALLVGALLIALAGINPWQAYSYLFKGAFGSLYGFSQMLTGFVPLIFTGLAFSVAYKAGFFNVGAEGQLYIGALGATIIGAYVKGLPPVLHITLAIIVAFASGAAWALIAGWMKVAIGSNEMINTMMLSYIASLLVDVLVQGALKDPTGIAYQSPEVAKSAQLPYLIPGTRLHLGFLFAMLAVFIYYYFLWRTPIGYQLRTIGSNSRAAAYAGINIVSGTIIAVIAAGGFGGLAGAMELLGSQHRILSGFSPGYGFDGIGVSVMGHHNPLGIILSALLFAFIRVGTGAMQRGIGVPSPLISVIQGLIIIMVIASAYLTNKLSTTVIGGRA